MFWAIRVIRDFTRVCEATGILDPDAAQQVG
jgi:hypothetical protein